MNDTEEREIVLDLPIPHIWDDGSVSELRLTRRAYTDCFALHSDRNDAIIIIGSSEHARALARALTIAADRLDRNPAS